MSIKRTISTDGFLLIEVIVACTLLAIIVVPIASYTWLTAWQIVRSEKQIMLLLSMRNYYELDSVRDVDRDHHQHTTTITRQELPTLMIDSVPLRPVCYEGTYGIGNALHTYRLISVGNACD